MDQKQLLYFKAIAETGSISEAARRLHITQPPLSYQMKLLEEELGSSLFVRSVKGVALTDAGKLLYPKALDILRLTDSTRQELLDFKKHHTLRIGMTPTSVPVMMELVQGYHSRFPSVRFEIHDGSTFQLLKALEQNIIEVSAVRTPANLEGLLTRPLSREPMMAAGTLLSGRSIPVPASLSDLEAYPWIIYRRYHELIYSALDHAGAAPHILCECDDARTALMWAEAGMGIAIFPMSMKKLCGSLTIVPIQCPELITDILLVTKKGHTLSPSAKNFWEFTL